MIPVIAIVGRPNVGKSTLFNVLTRTRNALVLDAPGVTRDRQYGQGEFEDQKYIVIDTGGLTEGRTPVESLMLEQSLQATEEADVIFFMVDGRSGRNPLDESIARRLRALSKPLFLLVNKTEGLQPEVALSEFYALGLSDPVPIAASHGHGISSLMEQTFEILPKEEPGDADLDMLGIKIAIVGRPNVGKSTLVNRMLGEDRVITFDEPGTTRDSIYIPLEREGKPYVLIDTAGVRRRARVTETLEKFSVIKTLQAIEKADVVIMVMDAREGITDQDLGLLGFVLETGRALVIALNKWDGLSQEKRDEIKKSTDYRLNFVNFARIHWISALHGSGVGNLFDSVQEAYQSAIKTLSTAELNRILESALVSHPPPMVQGRRIKLRYAHTGGHQPPIIVIHGNQTDQVPLSYKKYLANTFRKTLDLRGTPVRIEFKTSKNPYAERAKVNLKPAAHEKKVRAKASNRVKTKAALKARSASGSKTSSRPKKTVRPPRRK